MRLEALHSRLRLSCIMADKMSSTHKVPAFLLQPLVILIPTIGLQALANLSSHVAGRLAGVLLENPGLEAIHTVCVT